MIGYTKLYASEVYNTELRALCPLYLLFASALLALNIRIHSQLAIQEF
jgi:hypothetical protein